MIRVTTGKLFTLNYILIILCNFFFFLSFYFLVPILPKYFSEIGFYELQIGFLMGIIAVSSVVSKVGAGYGINRLGPGLIMIAGSAITCSVPFLYWTDQFFLLCFSRFIHGLGLGFFVPASIALVAEIAPVDRRGEAIGYFGISANIALGFAPYLSDALKETSYFYVFLIAVLISLVCLLFALAFRKYKISKPERSNVSGFSFKNILIPTFVLFSLTFAFGTITSFVPLYLQELKITNSGTFFMLYAVAVTVARVFSKISDKYGYGRVIICGMVISFFGLVLVTLKENVFLIYCSSVLFGLGFGIVFPGLTAFLIDNIEQGERGGALGIYTAAFDLGMGCGAFLTGVILHYVSYKDSFWLSALIVFWGLLLFIKNYWRGCRCNDSFKKNAEG